MARLLKDTLNYIFLTWISKGDLYPEKASMLLHYLQMRLNVVTKRDSAFEEGKEILPPFETSVGRVGLMICFDVRYQSLLKNPLLNFHSFATQRSLFRTNDKEHKLLPTLQRLPSQPEKSTGKSYSELEQSRHNPM